jgi:mannose-1-phosphate guanylyltransferase
MERAPHLAVVRGSFDWRDVGSWQAVASLREPDASGNRGQGTRVAIATRDTYVHAGERLVATVGVENLVIVDTPDAVLVAHMDHLQRVREVVDELKARGHDAHRLHQSFASPWGVSTVLQNGPGFEVVRIEIKPGGAMPLQTLRKKSKHWVVVSGEAQVTNGERIYALRANESTSVAFEAEHRLANPGNEPLTVIEIQCGDLPDDDEIASSGMARGHVKT